MSWRQAVGQVAPPAHLKPLHDDGAPGVQTPLTHAPAVVSESAPVVQIGFEQVVRSGYFRQPPAPLHVPSVPQLAAPSSAQNVDGTGVVPAATGVQAPVTGAHTVHDGQAGWPQQTPSRQLLFAHWSLPVHVAPTASLPVHAPTGSPAQKLPVEQSPSLAQVVRQAVVPLHMNAPQLVVVVCAHAPPLHVPAVVSVELIAGHEGGAHVVPGA